MNKLNSSYFHFPSQDTIISWIKEGNIQQFKHLIEMGFDLFQEDYHIRIAAQEGQIGIISFILEKGYPIHYRDYLILRDAIKCNQLDTLIFCFHYIEKESIHHSVEFMTSFKKQKKQLLLLAIEYENKNIIEYLISQHVTIDLDCLQHAMKYQKLSSFQLISSYDNINQTEQLDLIKNMTLAHMNYLEIRLQYGKIDLHDLSSLVGVIHHDLFMFLHTRAIALKSYQHLNETLDTQPIQEKHKI